MPPIGKPLKNDGPACRVCGCTENNACLASLFHHRHCRERRGGLCNCEAGRVGKTVPCSWAAVEASTPPLCSACSGTEEDKTEVLMRVRRYIEQHGTASTDLILLATKAAWARHQARRKLST